MDLTSSSTYSSKCPGDVLQFTCPLGFLINTHSVIAWGVNNHNDTTAANHSDCMTQVLLLVVLI